MPHWGHPPPLSRASPDAHSPFVFLSHCDEILMASTHSDIPLLGQTHVLPPLVLPDAPGGRCHQGFVVVQSSAWGSLSSGSSERLCKTSQGNGYRHWVVECSLIIHDFTVHRAPEPLCSLTESFSMNWVELRALRMHNLLVNATILLPMVNVHVPNISYRYAQRSYISI